MDKEKIVVFLLLVTIILSIGSLIVTFSLNIDKIPKPQIIRGSTSSANAGDVSLVVEQPTGGAT
jgi:hypothetical protein